MRKHQQKQVLELIKTMTEAYAEIKRLFSLKEYASVIQLLSDCQDFIVKIGSYIESIEGEGTRTVALLEDCHEALYQAGCEINGSNPDGGFIKRLREKFLNIESSVHKELTPNRTEVVFLPYKAAMWDSLESIWLAARDDPNCDAYVVPIPYYDRMPDGTMGQMHYEGDQYPAYVPITDWQAYDIEEKHPDIIFIHNPYDGGNHVTIIHPGYYSKRLKDLTDLLVYVPYFVCVDDVPEHFCVCSGTMHAGKVIVQSEKIRQTYIRVFKKFEKENHCAGKFGKAEEKFVALGSPKFDKVLHSKPEDFTLPDAWRKLVDKPDGAKKKAVLYNTSMEAMLRGEEAYLKKIRCVLDTFRKRDDAVLWWRPHPLNKAAYQSMRPQLLDEYEQIVTEYKREGFGIYDDTQDLHRALCLTSCYYGDWSSLVAMYQCTGKPVMIQDVGVLQTKQDPFAIAFENLYDDGEHFWFTAYHFNALFKMDKRSWKAEYMGSFPGEKPAGHRLYIFITAHSGKLYFAPGSAEEIASYDTATGVFAKICLDGQKLHPTTEQPRVIKFGTAIPYKEWLFFVGYSYPAFVRYNTVTGQLDSFSDWIKKIDAFTNGQIKTFFHRGITVNGSCFAVPACETNAVVFFDMDKCVSNTYEAGSKRCGYSGICYDGKEYWLSPLHDGPIVKWNPDTKVNKEYDSFPNNYVCGQYSFLDIAYVKDHAWLLPIYANMAVKIDGQTEEIAVAEEFQPECRYEKSGRGLLAGNYILSEVIGDVIYAHTGKSNRFIAYDCNTGHRREEPILLSQEAEAAMGPVYLPNLANDPSTCKSEYDCYFYENIHTPLSDFLCYVCLHSVSGQALAFGLRQTEIFKEVNGYSDGTSGTVTFAYCKRKVCQ